MSTNSVTIHSTPPSEPGLHHVVADLLDFPFNADVIMHGCNIHGVFGAGLAKALGKRYPTVAAVDKACRSQSLGTMLPVPLPPPDHEKLVINLYQQRLDANRARNLNYEALWCALAHAGKFISACERSRGRRLTVAVPYLLGCGLAGGNWNVVEVMLREALAGHRVLVCRLPKGKGEA